MPTEVKDMGTASVPFYPKAVEGIHYQKGFICPKCNRTLQDEDSECQCNISGRWSVELTTACPFCFYTFDVMKTDDYKSFGWEYFEDWFAQTSDQIEYELECPRCKKKLFMNRTEY